MSGTNPNKIKEPISDYGKEYTYSDYLQFQFEEMVELIRGKVFKMTPAPKAIHQKISSELHGNIWAYLKDKPCSVYAAPFDVVLPLSNEKKENATTVVQPDICIICDQSKINEAGCLGAPDLIIEILSKSTSKKDFTDKYSIYEEVGVKEYWIVMPNERFVEVFHLQNGKFQRIETYTETDKIASIIFPDLQIDLIEVFGKGE
jgi:Uma2 family endonuclease